MFIVIIWAAIVSNLSTNTYIYQECKKEKKCHVEIKKTGFELKK